MKIFALIFLTVSIKTTLQQSIDELMELAKSAVVDCYEDEENTKKIEITDTGLEDIVNGSRDAVRNAKCIRYCIMKRHNLLSANHALNVTELIPFLVYLFNNSVDNMQLKRIIEECNAVIGREIDRCERSHLANNCLLQHFNESGLKDI